MTHLRKLILVMLVPVSLETDWHIYYLQRVIVAFSLQSHQHVRFLLLIFNCWRWGLRSGPGIWLPLWDLNAAPGRTLLDISRKRPVDFIWVSSRDHLIADKGAQTGSMMLTKLCLIHQIYPHSHPVFGPQFDSLIPVSSPIWVWTKKWVKLGTVLWNWVSIHKICRILWLPIPWTSVRNGKVLPPLSISPWPKCEACCCDCFV
jgi:hypothetical protein